MRFPVCLINLINDIWLTINDTRTLLLSFSLRVAAVTGAIFEEESNVYVNPNAA